MPCAATVIDLADQIRVLERRVNAYSQPDYFGSGAALAA